MQETGTIENRKNQRFKSTAHVHIPNLSEDENLLKDLSISGCRIECPAFTKIQLNMIYQLEIIPEKSANTEMFVLEALPRWIRAIGAIGEIGFNVINSPKGRQFQNYVSYLTYRTAQA
ncbi:MAG: PilZ domain-containing protein [Treponema sp.]|nr:PilZ domain-containing protein [Treponema sp.]